MLIKNHAFDVNPYTSFDVDTLSRYRTQAATQLRTGLVRYLPHRGECRPAYHSAYVHCFGAWVAWSRCNQPDKNKALPLHDSAYVKQRIAAMRQQKLHSLQALCKRWRAIKQRRS